MKKRGFTIIELMDVVGIIGVLAAITLVFVQDAQKKSRDSKRREEIKSLQTALDLYFTGKNIYPVANHLKLTGGAGDTVTEKLLGEKDLTQKIVDPINNNIYFYDYTSGNGNAYTIVYKLESTGETVTVNSQ